jgi:DNA-binding FrmR family transcriptional regulator
MANHRRKEITLRVKRIHGHVHAIIEMLDEGRSYSEITHQVTAVRASLDGVAQVIIDDLVEDCVSKMNKKEPFDETLLQLQAVVRTMR